MHGLKESPRQAGVDMRKGVLLVDDHPILRAGLKLLVENQLDLRLCGEAATEHDGFTQFEQTRADLVVIDIGLQEGNGLVLVRRLRAVSSAVKIVIFTIYAERDFGERCLRAGANGFVSKQAPPTVILDAINTVLGDRPYFSPQFVKQFLDRANGSRKQSSNRGIIEALSTRELEVFRLLGEGLTTLQIATRLQLASSTIETYRDRLKTKLMLNSGGQLVREATLWAMETGGYSATSK